MFRFNAPAAALLICAALKGQSPSIGIFEGQSDIGAVLREGSAEYDTSTKRYTVSGGGENMWSTADEFHYVWTRVSARDVTLTANVAILGTATQGHRKGVLMIRQSLDPDSAYVDAARHGDGLTSLQYRDRKGAITLEVESNVSGPARLRLEKQGDTFYMWIAAENEPLQFSGGSARVAMQAPFYVGIGVCAHQQDAMEKVAFTDVTIDPRIVHPYASYSTVETVLLSGDARAGYVAPKHLTAPGWTPDGKSLTFEVDGQRQEVAFTPLKTAAPVGPPVTANTTNSNPPELPSSDEFNNVLPTLSPAGKNVAFISYTKAAPLDMMLRVMTVADRKVRTLALFNGEIGSLGPASWSPDGRRIAYISYQTMQPSPPSCRTPTQESLVYGQANGETLTMDYYAPKGDGPHPIAIIIHGGGYQRGNSKSGSEAYCADFLAPAGYAVFSINYRLAPKYPYPYMVRDVERAIRYLRHNAGQWNADPNRIALVGGSAGGFLSNMVGLLNAPGDAQAADPVDRESAKVQAVVTLFAQSSFATVPLNKDVHALLDPLIQQKGEAAALKEASPITYVQKGDPPFLLIQGDRDEYIPFSEDTNLQAALRGVGTQCDIIRIPNGQHGTGSWHTLPGVPAWEHDMVAWLNTRFDRGGPIGEGIRERKPT